MKLSVEEVLENNGPNEKEEGVIVAVDTSIFVNVRVKIAFGIGGAVKVKGICRFVVAPTSVEERLGTNVGTEIGVVTLTDRLLVCMYLIPVSS